MAISVGFSFAVYKISAVEIDRGLTKQGKAMRNIIGDQPFGVPFGQFDQFREQQMEESLDQLKYNLVYFNILILFLSSAASYYLARWTMRPIENALEIQNRFTADASHELRTPLTAMRTEIEVALRDEKLSLADAKKFLKSNIEEITKLESLSDSLLKLARYKESKDSLEKVNLPEVVTEAYQRVESLASKKKIEFKTKLDNLEIVADRQSIVELFVILLDNAIKYSENGKTIRVQILKQANRPTVKIIDEGIGIKASDINHIFDRFYRADISRTKTNVNGYGLGLSLAKQIVELNFGKISVESTAGKGSEFKVTF
jgi:signal transduction histidine kinase